MKIAGLVKTSTIDYPGYLSCVIFTAGCNYDCWYCHNRELLNDPKLLEEKDIFDFLEKRVGLLEAVVISGGEPTIQSDLHAFIVKVKELGYLIKMDTNGSHPELLRQLLDESLVDYVALDYKAPFDRYPELTRQTSNGLKESLAALYASNITWEGRTTVVRQLSFNDVLMMAKALPILPHYFLQRYRPVNNEDPGSIYSSAQIEELADLVRTPQPNVRVRE